MKAVFLDKDGTLIDDVPYNVDPARIRLAPGAAAALPRLHAAGYRLIVISNQSGVARGLFPEAALAAVEDRLRALLAELGAPLAGFYYCPHHPAGRVPGYARDCTCRKPAPGLLQRAAREHGVDLAASWFIGDILDDVEAGRRAGCRTVLLAAGNETEWVLTPERRPHAIVPDLAAAAAVVLADGGPARPAAPPGAPGAGAGGPVAVPAPLDLLDRFAGCPVLVIGEAMLDSYLTGRTGRPCAEAPVPIVDVARRVDAPGGAANTAVNVAALGGAVHFLSVAGADPEGGVLGRALAARGVEPTDLLIALQRRTLSKMRISGERGLLLRVDGGSTGALDPATENALLTRLAPLWVRCRAVIVSDYGYGILTPRVREVLAALQAGAPRILVVDAKHLPAYRGLGVTAVKPNYAQALALLDLPPGPGDRLATVLAHQAQILERTGAQIAAVTLDAAGGLILQPGRPPHRVAARPAPPAQAAGAGDTFVAALTLALAAGAPPAVAGDLAAAAAAVVVAQPGTTPCTAAALRAWLARAGRPGAPVEEMRFAANYGGAS